MLVSHSFPPRHFLFHAVKLMGSAQNYSDSAEYASLRQIRGTAFSSRYCHRCRRAVAQSDLWVDELNITSHVAGDGILVER